jgi:hypothetical protein
LLLACSWLASGAWCGDVLLGWILTHTTLVRVDINTLAGRVDINTLVRVDINTLVRVDINTLVRVDINTLVRVDINYVLHTHTDAPLYPPRPVEIRAVS